MEYNQGGFFRFSYYVYQLLILNLLFVLTNILLFAALIILIPSISNALLYYIAFIPTGPSLAALFHSLSSVMKENGHSFVKDFLSAYKNNFVDVLKVWVPIITVFFILLIDIQYFNQNPTLINQVLNGIFIVLLLLLVLLSIYSLMITTHYTFRLRDTYRLSIFYMLTWIKRSTGNIAILFLTVVFMFFTSDFIILFISSLVAWFLVLNTLPVIHDVGTSFVKTEKEGQTQTI
ncbi:DUF624 domain-containing protein [Gracilibacillus salinarum]|uniref:DUF624 domain-containing protein n=1 Tax=Gracilibacillus salinarum TaxID=2932255 RepID=A0ABY4GLL7_9BACI|nr:DUF624 domain-containing protein [Gracilibacillus salinarum]UOQ85111.1 DUF624 domain-containing protein [Gracilibacillus salinarum]